MSISIYGRDSTYVGSRVEMYGVKKGKSHRQRKLITSEEVLDLLGWIESAMTILDKEWSRIKT